MRALFARRETERSHQLAKKLFIMSDLSKKKCIACDGNIAPFDKSEIHKYLKKVDDWEVKKGGGRKPSS